MGTFSSSPKGDILKESGHRPKTGLAKAERQDYAPGSFEGTARKAVCGSRAASKLFAPQNDTSVLFYGS